MNDMREQVEFYLENNIKIHADLKDGTYLNGLLIKKTKENIYWLEEVKLGKVFLFLKTIRKINEYKPKVEVRG